MGKIFTTETAADYLGISSSRIRQLIMEGKLQSEKYGRDHIIRESALKEYLKLGKKKPGRKPNK